MSPVLLGFVLLAGGAVAGLVALGGVTAPRLSPERLTGVVVSTERSRLTDLTNAVVGWVDRLMSSRGWFPFSSTELELAGIVASPASFVVLILSMAVSGFAVGLLLLGGALAGAIVALVTIVGAKVVVKVKTSRRRRRFAEQLHEALQMLASSLRAGHSIARAIETVAHDSDSPISEELARAVNENRLGRDLVASLENVAARMESEDFQWTAQAIATQRETGGNLNEVLDQVAETIRERSHIRQQVFALSAEGRISAYILMALPVGIGVFYFLVNPGVMGVFVDATIGKILLAASAVMYVVAGLWMRKIVNIDF
jgi:tight adherence protein B